MEERGCLLKGNAPEILVGFPRLSGMKFMAMTLEGAYFGAGWTEGVPKNYYFFIIIIF